MRLTLPDAQTTEDLRTYVARARSADEEGAIRLQASGTTLAAYVGILPGMGLMAQGAVVGLRTMRLADPAEVDVTVSLAAVADRLARGGGTALELPPLPVRVGWAAVAPPRSGWERVGALSAQDVVAVARAGIAEVAAGTPDDAGAQAVAALRRRVWSRSTTTTPPIPAGGAFAAYVLGFTGSSGSAGEPASPGQVVTVWAHGRWTRLTTAAGHVLMR
ncbi:hypothetical protein [Pedococcus sp. 5OH_020]|uniref:hypothetical protein n=1 Tax=Pedococcus sp. 5OH_020 TaxID=2989814 RepID=UPI0022EA0777|nr:hypothetical protein [Pedococcus sp. 5OH_020]